MLGSLIENACCTNTTTNNNNNNETVSDSEVEKKKAAKNDLFDMLETRILDVNSYTRSKVLQTWSRLVEEKLVPVTRLCHSLIPAVRGRLQDKAALVRRQA